MAGTKAMPRKATDIIKMDHKMVKRLFADYENLEDGDSEEKIAIFEKIRRELMIHSQMEEEEFYPTVESTGDKDARELVQEAQEEHKIVKMLLEELEALEPGAEPFDAKMKVLRGSVEHHADEEEKEIFRKVNQLSREERDDLAARLMRCKERLETEIE